MGRLKGRQGRTRGEQSGFILIFLLFLSALVTGMVLLMSKQNTGFLKCVRAIEMDLALAGEVESLTKLLAPDIKRYRLRPPYVQQIGHCLVSVTGSNAMLDLNRARRQEITRLCEALGADPEQADIVGDSIADWVDKDSTGNPMGAESAYYAHMNPPYKAKNAHIEEFEEIYLIRGMTPDLAAKLRPFVSFKSEGQDISQVPREVLYALVGDWDVVDDLEEYRKEGDINDESLKMLLGSTLYLQLMTRYTFEPSPGVLMRVTGRLGSRRLTTWRWIFFD